MSTSSAARRGRKTSFNALLRLQEKIDGMTLGKRPTEVRLNPANTIIDDFKKSVRIGKAGTPELVQIALIQTLHFGF